jgi:hypothetical protein
MPRTGFTVEMPEEGEEWLFGEEAPICGECFRQATEKVEGSV